MKKFGRLGLGLVVALAISVSACNQNSGNNAQTAASAKNDSDLVPVANSLKTTKGAATAPVTIVEFSDFECPFCSRVVPTLKQIEEKYAGKVRVVFKQNPLPFHKNAMPAAQASIAAANQGKFWEMHDKMFANQKALSVEDLKKYAAEIGLDVAKFEADMNSDAVKAQVKADMDLANKLGIRGTPNSLVNGKEVSGAQPFENFQKVIDEELAEVQKLTAKGTAANEVYKLRVKANYKEKKAPTPKQDASKTVYKMPLDPTSVAIKGGSEPLVTIVEFSEFQCPFCARVLPTVKQVMDTYGDKVQVHFRNNPLPFHKDAPLASQAALAAGMQGKFWEMHDKLFANQKALSRENLLAYAEELGLDKAKFESDMDSDKVKEQIKADQAVASQFGANGTPNFFINGRQLVGAQPFENFKALIDEEVKKAEDLIKNGTARKDVYAKLTEKGLTKAAAPQRPEPAEDKTTYKVPVSDDEAKNARGPANALVTIVEFSDFQCPFCNRVVPTLKQIAEKYPNDVRVIFKQNPLPFHKDAPLAAQAALAAGMQGKFWEMHDKLFANQKALGRENLLAYAAEIGLDKAKFEADMDSDKVKAQIKADQDLAAQIGASGTPNFYINGRNIVGAQPVENFTKLIDEQLAAAKAMVAKGTKAENVYSEIIKNGAEKKAAPAGRPAEDPNKVYTVKIDENKDAMWGSPKAPITIVEFSDFQCPFCNRVVPTIKQLEQDYGDKIRIVFKHNPLPFHKDAPLASQAALAAKEQGKFWEMHDMLFNNQKALTKDDLDKYAQELGLNVEKFKADFESEAIKAQINADKATASDLGATGTPAFFINGRKIKGAQPIENFKKLIDEELKKLGK